MSVQGGFRCVRCGMATAECKPIRRDTVDVAVRYCLKDVLPV